MRRDGWKSGLVWVALALALGGALASAARDGSRSVAPPGHTATTCGARGAHQPSRGPALPYELGGDNLRSVRPAVAGDHGSGPGG